MEGRADFSAGGQSIREARVWRALIGPRQTSREALMQKNVENNNSLMSPIEAIVTALPGYLLGCAHMFSIYTDETHKKCSLIAGIARLAFEIVSTSPSLLY